MSDREIAAPFQTIEFSTVEIFLSWLIFAIYYAIYTARSILKYISGRTVLVVEYLCFSLLSASPFLKSYIMRGYMDVYDALLLNFPLDCVFDRKLLCH